MDDHSIPPPFGGKYECFNPDPSWNSEERQLWLDRQRAIGAQQLLKRPPTSKNSRELRYEKHLAKLKKLERRREKKERQIAKAARLVEEEDNTDEDKYAPEINSGSSFAPGAPCCVCQSIEHQLSGHPNPNTPEGYLRGCLPCNTLEHSYAQCQRFKPGAKKCELYHWYRKGRAGLCPGEWHGDIREIRDRDGKYHLQDMPLTPAFALRNLYSDGKGFKRSGRNGDRLIMSDPHWTSDQAWANLGSYSNPMARVDAAQLAAWESDANSRYVEISKSLVEQYTAAEPPHSAPTAAQFFGFSIFSWLQKPQHLNDPVAILQVRPETSATSSNRNSANDTQGIKEHNSADNIIMKDLTFRPRVRSPSTPDDTQRYEREVKPGGDVIMKELAIRPRHQPADRSNRNHSRSPERAMAVPPPNILDESSASTAKPPRSGLSDGFDKDFSFAEQGPLHEHIQQIRHSISNHKRLAEYTRAREHKGPGAVYGSYNEMRNNCFTCGERHGRWGCDPSRFGKGPWER